VMDPTSAPTGSSSKPATPGAIRRRLSLANPLHPCKFRMFIGRDRKSPQVDRPAPREEVSAYKSPWDPSGR